MIRRSLLSKDAVLWWEGDSARYIAVLERGRLGIRTDSGLLGVVLPGMILGETAILALEGGTPRRTASVVALDEGTEVTEYPAFAIKQMLAAGRNEVAVLVLRTLIGQIGRSSLVIMSVNRDRPFIRGPMKELLTGIVQSAADLTSVGSWEEFLRLFRFLAKMRDDLGGIRSELTAQLSVGPEVMDRITSTIKELFGDVDTVRYLDDFVRSEDLGDMRAG